jgi:hypothetical protein
VLALTIVACGCGGGFLRREHDPQVTEGHTLPLRRVRLYASGMGYFERRGEIGGRRDTLPVPATHLDDALKSLVLLSPGGQLGSVTFASRVSPAVARARAGLPAQDDSALSFDRLLASLRGELVEARVGDETLRGRVIEVLAVSPSHSTYPHAASAERAEARGEEEEEDGEVAEEPDVLQLSLLSDQGALHMIDVRSLTSIRPLQPAVLERLESALAARLSLRSGRPQSLALEPLEAGPLALGYLAETAVWRPSYRLVVADRSVATSARLQAWALIHNDTDEPWSDVTIELANGMPESFLFPLSAPRYDRRALRTPDRELSSVPELSATTPDAMWGDFSDYQGESVERVGDDASAGLGGGSGYGRGAGGFRGRDVATREEDEDADERPLTESSLLAFGDLSLAAGEEPAPTTALSVFVVPSKLALLPHHSAMVPFLEGTIDTRSLTWFSTAEAAPQVAVAIRNDTANSLPPGPLTVFRAGGFEGETLLDALSPGQRRFACIGRDEEIELRTLSEREHSEERRVTFSDGELHIHLARTTERELRLGSRAAQAREVYVGLEVVKNATVRGADRLDYDRSTRTALAVFDVEPGRSRALHLVTLEGLLRSIELAAISVEELEGLVGLESLALSERNLLRGALPLARQVEDVVAQVTAQLEELESVQDDVKRLREHLSTLAKSEAGAAQQPLVARLLESDELLRLQRAKQRALRSDLSRKRAALEQALRALPAT